MVDVSALYNMDVSRIEDIYLGVGVTDYKTAVYYVFALVKDDLHKCNKEVLGTYYIPHEASLGLLNFKTEFENFRKEDVE